MGAAPAPVTTATPSSAPPGGGSPPSVPRRRSRRSILIVVGAIATVALLLFALLGFGSGPAAPGGLDYATARSEATPVAADVSGGSWTLRAAVGVDERNGTALSLAQAASGAGSNCTLTAEAGAPPSGEVEIPAYTGALSAGLAPVWLFIYSNGTGVPFLLVLVTAAGAVPLAEATGASCGSSLTHLGAVPTSLIDSPSAASAAWSSGGSEYGTPTLTMIAVGAGTYGGFSIGASWVFDYAPCVLLATGGSTSGTSFLILVDGLTGAVDLSLSQPTTCP
jgi:hypothetical protein